MRMEFTLKYIINSILLVFALSSVANAAPSRMNTTDTEPATCTVGDLWIDTNGTAGNSVYTCTAADTDAIFAVFTIEHQAIGFEVFVHRDDQVTIGIDCGFDVFRSVFSIGFGTSTFDRDCLTQFLINTALICSESKWFIA